MENPKVINGYVLSIGPSSLEDDNDLNAKPYLRVLDFGSVVKLPRYVAFKGENGKFLTTTRSINHVTYHHTFVAEDEHDPNSRYEILYTKSGNIHVKSVSANIFWRFNKLSSKMLGKDHTFHTAKACEIEVLQRPDQPNKVCLRIARNRNYLGSRLSMKRTTKHALLPIGEAFKSATLLEVVEPIVHRRIDRMQFRLEHARIYDQTPVTVFNAEIPNVTDQEHMHAAEVSYTVTKSSSWNNGFTLTSGVKTTFETGFPCIADGKFEVHAQISKEHKWGECVQTSEHVKSTYTVPVVAKMRTMISVLGSKAKWEIPFSYVQTDTLQDMKKLTTRFDDGVYTGVLAYDFLHKTHYEPL